MAGSARIGSLHVLLGIDSAQFTAGLTKATTGLDRFGRMAKIGLAAVATAAASAGAALSYAVKGAIDHADELSKTAQRVGVTTEALSRLEWAAKLSDVSLGQLATGMQRLSRNMLDVSQGGGAQAATAFEALGIAVKDAGGNLRSSDEVFADVAEKFAAMPDGVEKTALAMQLFGRAGAEMIPLLNAGREGLAAMAEESDRLGNTISGNTGRAAEAFNDSLTRIQAVMGGVVNRIMEAVLPSLNNLINVLASPEFAANAAQIATAIVDAMKIVVDAVNTAVGAFNSLRESMEWASTHDMFGNEIVGGRNGPKTMLPGFVNQDQALDGLRNGTGDWSESNITPDFFQGIFGEGAPATEAVQDTDEVLTELATTMQEVADTSSSAGSGVGNLATAIEGAKPVMEELGDTIDTSLQGIGSSLAGLIKGTSDWADVASAALQSILQNINFGGMGPAGGLLQGLLGGLASFASGTNFAPGGLSLVGERGPELVNLPRGSQVIPNHELSAGGGNLHVTVGVAADGNGNIMPFVQSVARAEAGAASVQTYEAVKQSFSGWQANMQVHGAP